MKTFPMLGRLAGAGVLAGGALLLAGAAPARANHVESTAPYAAGHAPRLVMPMMNPARGKTLFAEKACVACHAINGVGGHDAPNLDAHRMAALMNPFDFAAKMWNHAPAMIAAQEGAFGQQILVTGQELADIIAFVHDDEAQHAFTEADLPPKVRGMLHHEHGGRPGSKAHRHELGHDRTHAPPGRAPRPD